MKPDDMSCGKFREQTDEYIDGMLSEAAAADFRAHLEVCAGCRAVYLSHLAVSRAAADAGEELPDGLHSRIMRAVGTEAAADRRRRLERQSRRFRLASVGFAAAFCVFIACFTVIMLPLSLAGNSGGNFVPFPLGDKSESPSNDVINQNEITSPVLDGVTDPNPGGSTGVPESVKQDTTVPPQTTALPQTTASPQTTATPEGTASPQTAEEVTKASPETTKKTAATGTPDITMSPQTTATPVSGTAATPDTTGDTEGNSYLKPTDGTADGFNNSVISNVLDLSSPPGIAALICIIFAAASLAAAVLTFIRYRKLKNRKERNTRK